MNNFTKEEILEEFKKVEALKKFELFVDSSEILCKVQEVLKTL